MIKLKNLRTLLKGSSVPQPQPEFKKILELTKNLTSKNNSKLYFVHLPEINVYKSNYNKSNYLAVKKIVNELDIPFIDMNTEIFEKEQNPFKLIPFLFKSSPNSAFILSFILVATAFIAPFLPSFVAVSCIFPSLSLK